MQVASTVAEYIFPPHGVPKLLSFELFFGAENMVQGVPQSCMVLAPYDWGLLFLRSFRRSSASLLLRIQLTAYYETLLKYLP